MMLAEILTTLPEHTLRDVRMLVGLATIGVICIALYTIWPDWRWTKRKR